jgi:quinol-cytochrome oxidoreductase complex cytochrome b subunit
MSENHKPSEKGFSAILLIIGILALIESVKMFKKEPTSSSFGALPLFLSSIVVIFMLKILIFENKKSDQVKKLYNLKDLVDSVVRYILHKDIVMVFLLLIVYCFMLVFGLGFEFSSTIFLITSMTYLMKGQIIKNAIYTGLAMAFILIVFKTIFQVILP